MTTTPSVESSTQFYGIRTKIDGKRQGKTCYSVEGKNSAKKDWQGGNNRLACKGAHIRKNLFMGAFKKRKRSGR